MTVARDRRRGAKVDREQQPRDEDQKLADRRKLRRQAMDRSALVRHLVGKRVHVPGRSPSMILDDLRSLRATLSVAIDLVTRLQPVLDAWQGGAAQELPGAPPAAAAPPTANPPAEGGLAQQRPAAAESPTVSPPAPETPTRTCAECGATFPFERRAARRRYCSTRCGNRADAHRRAQRKAATRAAQEPATDDQPADRGHQKPVVDVPATLPPRRFGDVPTRAPAVPPDPNVTQTLRDLSKLPAATAVFRRGSDREPPRVEA